MLFVWVPLQELQLVQNASLLSLENKIILPQFYFLQCPPITFCIDFIIALLTPKALHDLALNYTRDEPGCPIRSAQWLSAFKPTAIAK